MLTKPFVEPMTYIPRKLFPPVIVKLAKPAFMEKESNFGFMGAFMFLLSPRLPLELFLCLDI